MYISGHLQILKDILKKFKDKSFNVKRLKKGLIYPDLPCGKFEIKNNNVILANHKLCNQFYLYNLLLPVNSGEKNIFQNHRGYFAHLHSMTTDPENNMLKIRNKILTSIIGYCLLSIYDNKLFDNKPKITPNIFWIGIILHIITDSYTSGHAIRGYKTKYRFSRHQAIDKLTKKRLNVHEIIKKIAKEDLLFDKKHKFINELKSKVNQNSYEIDYITADNNILFNIYKVFKFEYNTNKKVAIYEKKFKKLLRKGFHSQEREYDIIAFQYINNQPALLHSKLDFISNLLKNKILYDKMIKECIQVLKLYKEFLNDHDVDKFINKMFLLMYNEIFRINSKYIYNKTNKVIIDKDYEKYIQPIRKFFLNYSFI